jgi:glycosyltransferase involved in cell wall biosynthesis
MDNAQVVSCPRITVAMPVLNGGEYLLLAVFSIVNQTYENWELLILDDGSTDGSIEKLSSAVDKRIVVIRDGTRRGIASRLNQAIDLARGEFFARMDHDDISHPDRLLKQLDFLETNPRVDLLANKCFKVDERNCVTGELPFDSSHARICARPWLGFAMPHPSWMGKTSWFKENRYREPAPFCCEDSEMLLRTHKHSIFDAIEIPLLAYRVRSHTPWRKLWRTRIALVSVQLRYFAKQGDLISATLACGVTMLRFLRDFKSEVVHRCGLVDAAPGVENANKLGLKVQWIDELKHKAPEPK